MGEILNFLFCEMCLHGVFGIDLTDLIEKGLKLSFKKLPGVNRIGGVFKWNLREGGRESDLGRLFAKGIGA
jgi:hypothetical protein